MFNVPLRRVTAYGLRTAVMVFCFFGYLNSGLAKAEEEVFVWDCFFLKGVTGELKAPMRLLLRSRSQEIFIQKANGIVESASGVSWSNGVAQFKNLEEWPKIDIVITIWYHFDSIKGTLLQSMSVIDTHRTSDDGLVRLMQSKGECRKKDHEVPLAQ